ncbi:uncharacterized protein LOC131693194 [Topomyia yanbarensis]|uniref:uncharacterized protein LOC131693194 n=1 Tax=Topomyia yanbarensis TaxID=2498891 RepID=UPI00273BF342|nr:uncharacterized protein LOC131693194 [Topomyia yanbarensis]
MEFADEYSEYRDEIPRRLHNQLAFVKRIVISRKCVVLVVIINDGFQLLEVKERAIIASIQLAQFLTATGASLPVPSIFGTLSPIPEPELNDSKEISFSVFRSNDRIERKLFYLISIDRKLVVIEREDQPLVKFVHFQTYESYIRHEITEMEDRPGFPAVKIYLEHQTAPIVTNFQAYRVEPNDASVNNFTCFHEIQRTLKEQTNEKQAELATIRSMTGELFDQLNDRLKQVPGLLRTENPDEKRPLVKYGDIWTKVHNEQLVIGFPVFNCTYKRRQTLTNLSLLLDNPSLNRFEYRSKFYQLDDDDFTFKNYKQILAVEDIISDVPLFQQEWTEPKINVLHSEQTAVFVAIMKLSSAINHLDFATTFQCFVTYDVATLEADLCDRLQLYLGSVEVKRSDLYSENLAVTFKDQRSLFKDLLSITATSEFISIEVSFDQTPNRGLDRFFAETLKFQSINLTCSTDLVELPNILYYGDNGYWQAVLIRLDELNDSRQKIKIYGRHKHQILTILQTIYTDYEEKCSIKLTEDINATLEEFKDSILNELRVKIDKPLATEEILSHELKTDCIFSKLSLS